MGEREDGGSGGSGGNGGDKRASPEVGDWGFAAEAWPGVAQWDCIDKRVREKLTFFLSKKKNDDDLTLSKEK